MLDVIGKLTPVVPVKAPSQLSVAVGAVNDAISHCAVSVGKLATLATGSVVSSIITAWVCVAVLPLASV